MKKFIAAVAGITMAVGMSACAGSAGSESTVTETVNPYVEPEVSEDTTDETFIAYVKDNTGLTGTDQEFLTLSKAVCTSFDTGSSFMETITVLTDSGFDNYDAGFFVGASVSAYCPEHSDLFE